MTPLVKRLPKPELWKSGYTLVVLKQKLGVEALTRSVEKNSAYEIKYYFNQVQNGNGIHVPSFPKMTLAMKIDWPVFLADLQDRKLHFDCLTFHVMPKHKTAVVSSVLPEVESSVLSALSIIAAHDLGNRENVSKIRGPRRRAEDRRKYSVKKWNNLIVDDLAFAFKDYVKRSSVQLESA